MITQRDIMILTGIFLWNVLSETTQVFANYQNKCLFASHGTEGSLPLQGCVLTSAAAAFSGIESYESHRTLPRATNSFTGSTINHLPLFNIFDETKPNSKKNQCTIPPVNCPANDTKTYYYRSLDGSCNNLQHPSYGMAKSRYTRMMAPKYGDGFYTPSTSVTGAPLPNARLLSLSLYGDNTLPDTFRTMAALQWGQIVGHDLSHFTKNGAPENCCNNVNNKLCYPIALHPSGPISSNSNKRCLDFARSISDQDAICGESGLPYSEKITLASAYLDLSSLYGNDIEQNRKVRQYKCGFLKTTIVNNRHWMPISSNSDGECGEGNYQCYSIPDMRNQFIPTIAVLHTLLMREHNRIAQVLAHLNPQYSDEQLFQEARKINIAQYQKITYYDWLPLIVGPSQAYAHGLIHSVEDNLYADDYDPSVNPAPYAGFAAAAFRYAHNQIPGWFSMVAPGRDYNSTMRLSDYFERPENVNFLAEGDNFDSLIRGLATQLQKRPDNNIDKEIKHFFDRKAFEQFGADLKAIDIQRGRDYGLPSYNDYRQYCGLSRASHWSEFNNEISAEQITKMQQIYASPDDVDLSVGGALESHVPESILGPTFLCIISKQFLKVRTGDRFFFERNNIYSGFTSEQLTEIRKASISGLFCKNADYLRSIQTNSFIFPNTRNILRSCNSLPQIDLSKWKKPQRNSF